MRMTPLKNVGPLSLVTDWTTLGSLIHVKPYILAYALRNRDSLQRRIRLQKRVVYKSGRSLQFIQNRLSLVFAQMVDDTPGNECAIAYRKGQSPIEIVKGCAGYHTLITTDIRKYYDHVKLRHIEAVLKRCGLQRLGARLMGRYCIACGALQQGSPASPALSNLVGIMYIDEPIKQWLAKYWPDTEVRYIRYCDNIAVFVKKEPPEGFYESYKAFVKDKLRSNGFSTHAWNKISQENPKRNQAFLGVVLNHTARVERANIDRLRALFFTRCVHGSSFVAEQLMRERGGERDADAHEFVNNLGHEGACEKIKKSFRGHMAYVTPINQKHGAWLSKLYSAGNLLDEHGDRPHPDSSRGIALRKVLCTYKKPEPEEIFMRRLTEFITTS